jgi:acyl-CoA thioesterase-1
LGLPLPHIAHRVAARLPIKIVAVGSSSTAGAGASSSAASYPSRLEVELKARFPLLPITVLNRGVNGEEAWQMLARFDQAVIAERPDLVIWQVGTNALLLDEDLARVAEIVHQGLDRLKAQDTDVIVIDPQVAPKVIANPRTEPLVELLAASAKKENVAYFHRFALMRQWSEIAHLPFEQFLSPDGIHMNDWSYACMAKLLAAAIADAATRVPQTAHIRID